MATDIVIEILDDEMAGKVVAAILARKNFIARGVSVYDGDHDVYLDEITFRFPAAQSADESWRVITNERK